MATHWKLGIASSVFMLWASLAGAADITCQPDNERVATLGDAIECQVKNGPNANINTSADVNALFGTSETWVKEGEVTGNGTNDLFTVNLTSGSWGNNNVAGTWSIDSSFWSMYANAVISMHVGEGNGDPDAFAWLITPGTLSGTFSYSDLDGRGGGLSNLFLFGSGVSLPESNNLILLLIGLVAIFFARRRQQS